MHRRYYHVKEDVLRFLKMCNVGTGGGQLLILGYCNSELEECEIWGPLAPGANEYGLNNFHPHRLHIFGKLWTCPSIRRQHPGEVIPLEFFDKRLFLVRGNAYTKIDFYLKKSVILGQKGMSLFSTLAALAGQFRTLAMLWIDSIVIQKITLIERNKRLIKIPRTAPCAQTTEIWHLNVIFLNLKKNELLLLNPNRSNARKLSLQHQCISNKKQQSIQKMFQ